MSSRSEDQVVGKVSHTQCLGFCSEQGETTRDFDFYKVHQGHESLLSDRLVHDSVCSCIHLFCLFFTCTSPACPVQGQKTIASYSLELELKMVVSYYVDAGN